MDETNPTQVQETNPVMSQPSPTYSSSAIQPKKKGSKTVPVILMTLALILIAVGGFFVLGKKSSEQEVSPTPESLGINVVEEETPEPLESARPIDRKSISIEVQNGTGIAKEASYLQDILRNLGYTEVTTGNASKQDYTDTVITFSSDLNQEAVDEITKELEKVYKNVQSKTASNPKTDVVIITGLKKGTTPKPSATVSATSSPKSATPTPSASPTVTPTPTTLP